LEEERVREGVGRIPINRQVFTLFSDHASMPGSETEFGSWLAFFPGARQLVRQDGGGQPYFAMPYFKFRTFE
jgi:hypothetical protein